MFWFKNLFLFFIVVLAERAICQDTAWSFPPFFGCPTLPTAQPINEKNLPLSIQNALAQVDIALQSIQDDLGTVGVSAAVVYNQSLVWFSGYGYADKSKGTSVQKDTIFRIGSISKVFTTVAAMILRDRGVFQLDDQVASYFPKFSLRNPFPSTRGITFRQLATHLAGLPRESPCPFEACSLNNDQIFALLQQLQYILPPDTLPIYSNLGFALLGNMVASLVNQTYEDLILREIVTPLGLLNSGVNMTKAQTDKVAVPYNDDGTVCNPSDCLSDFGWANPEGSIYSTAEDLGKLLSFFFRDSTPSNFSSDQILDGATIREMMRIQWLNNDRNSGFAMPFELTKLGEFMLRLKRGDVDGYASEIVMVPSMKLGIIVLTNIVEHAPPYAQAMCKILVPTFGSVLSTMKPISPLPPNYQKYLGNYI